MTFPFLGWNPAPGEPDIVRRSAGELTKVSEIAEDAGGALRAISSSDALSAWNGEASEKFRGTLDQLCTDLGSLQRSYHDASAALARYASRLDAAQAEAYRAEAEASAAKAQHDVAARRVDTARSEANQHASQASQANLRATNANTQLVIASAAANIPAAEDLVHKVQQEQRVARQAASLRDQANQRAHQAETERAAADNRIDAARKLGSQAQELRDDAVRAAERDLNAASDQGIQPRDPITAMWDGAKEFLGSKEFDQFLTVISDIGQLLVEASLPLTLAAMGIGFAIGGPVGALVGAEIGNVVSLAGVGLLGVAFVGRLAQTAANPEQSDKLLLSGANLAMGAFSTVGGKGLKLLGTGDKVLDLGGRVKRSFDYTGGRRLSGGLWDVFDAAPKPVKDKAFGVIPAEPFFKVSTGADVLWKAHSLVGDMGKIGELGAQLSSDLTNYQPPGHGQVREDTLKLAPDFARPVTGYLYDHLPLGVPK